MLGMDLCITSAILPGSSHELIILKFVGIINDGNLATGQLLVYVVLTKNFPFTCLAVCNRNRRGYALKSKNLGFTWFNKVI